MSHKVIKLGKKYNDYHTCLKDEYGICNICGNRKKERFKKVNLAKKINRITRIEIITSDTVLSNQISTSHIDSSERIINVSLPRNAEIGFIKYIIKTKGENKVFIHFDAQFIELAVNQMVSFKKVEDGWSIHL